MRSLIHFLNTKNMKPAEIHQLCDLYGERAISRSMVRKWMRMFHEGHKMCMMIRGAAERLWWMKIFCVQLKRRLERTDDSPLRYFPCIFFEFHGHFFTKYCLINLSFGNCVHTACRRCLRNNTNWNGRPVLWTVWHDTVRKTINSWAV
jgi:hypothetical protein